MPKIKISAMIILIVACCLFTIQSCKKHKTAAVVGSCDPSKIYFERDVLPIINSNCNMSGCHTGKIGEESSLKTYYKIYSIVSPGNAQGSRLIEMTNGSSTRRMPPNGYNALSEAQITILSEWINQGALNEVCTESGNCDTTNLTYSKVVATILANNCTGCHGGSSPSAGIDLSTYSGVQPEIANGKLIGTINQSSGYKAMPPSGKLTDCEISKVQQWVKTGAANN